MFYVGKGTKNRIDDHEKEAKKGVCSHKCNKIRSLPYILKQKIALFNDEQEAYDFETERIAFYGLKNLTNVVAGGQGAFSLRLKRLEYKKRKNIKQKSAKEILINGMYLLHDWAVLTNYGEYEVKTIPSGNKLNDAVSLMAKNIYNNHIKSVIKEAFEFEDKKDLLNEIKRYGLDLWRLEKIAA